MGGRREGGGEWGWACTRAFPPPTALPICHLAAGMTPPSIACWTRRIVRLLHHAVMHASTALSARHRYHSRGAGFRPACRYHRHRRQGLAVAAGAQAGRLLPTLARCPTALYRADINPSCLNPVIAHHAGIFVFKVMAVIDIHTGIVTEGYQYLHPFTGHHQDSILPSLVNVSLLHLFPTGL